MDAPSAETVRSRRRPSPLAVVIAVMAMVGITVVGGLWWAGAKGYVPPFWQGGWGCSDVGYPSPPPSYEELVGKYHESPYCAREVRGETWF
jgi:hypothetical protein